MQTKDLPDLDKMTPAELETAAQLARIDQLALERIQSILSEAQQQDKLDIATLAILLRRESCQQIRFSLEHDCSPILTEASRYLRRISDDEEKLALAIAILEGVQTEREGDAIVPPDLSKGESLPTSYTYADQLKEYLRKKLDGGIAEHLVSAFPFGEGAVSFHIRPIPPIRPITALGSEEEDFILLTFEYPDDDGEAIVPPDCEFSGADVALTEDTTLRGLQQLR